MEVLVKPKQPNARLQRTRLRSPLSSKPLGVSHSLRSDAIPTLYRYFIWSNFMRIQFQKALRTKDWTPNLESIAFMAEEPFIYMTYWYASLYVVVEGWQQLGLHDPDIDALLESPSVELLRRFRNGAFHYQEPWLDPRLTDFCGVLENVDWTTDLTARFGRYLNAEVRRITQASRTEPQT